MCILPVILALALGYGQSGEANAKPSQSCTAQSLSQPGAVHGSGYAIDQRAG
jgi:hypothetical protein